MSFFCNWIAKCNNDCFQTDFPSAVSTIHHAIGWARRCVGTQNQTGSVFWNLHIFTDLLLADFAYQTLVCKSYGAIYVTVMKDTSSDAIVFKAIRSVRW